MIARQKTTTPKRDFAAEDQEILSRLDIAAEYKALGARLEGEADSDGWVVAREMDREDRNPSAALNVETGRWVGHASGDRFSLYDFAAKFGPFADWQEAKRHFAEKAGVTLQRSAKKNRNQKADPAAKLDFFDGLETFANFFCQYNPGVTIEALKLVGARTAYYRGNYLVIALPIYGADLIDGGPVGWIIQDFMGGKLPRFDKSGKVVEWVKRKITYGSQPGVVGDAAARGLADPNTAIVYKMEGPSDMLAMVACLLAEPRPGTIAITTGCGAGERLAKLPWLIDRLKGRELRIIHDCDEAGQRGAEAILADVAHLCTAKNFVLPYPVQKNKGPDFRDYKTNCLSQGVTQLLTRLDTAFEKIEPAKPTDSRRSAADSEKDHFSNAEIIEDQDENGEEKTTRVPLEIDDILEDLYKRTDGWPRRLGSTLFYDAGGKIAWLNNPPALFGYLNAKLGRVNWHGGVGYLGRAELFEHLRNTAEEYSGIEHLPHFPPMAGHYYACQTPEPGDGKALDGLLARYRPSTTIDADLLKAALVTLFWGGPGGARPAFVITSDAGRGAGKTKAAESLAYVAGGHLDISAQEDIQKIKERLLTPAALSKRVALMDNVKSHKFSSAELEALITCRDISGRALYVGDSCRPNVITWLVTLNGVSLSNDLAQRSVIIKIDRGRNDAGWYETTLDFIDKNRQAIIADCAAFLAGPTNPLSAYSRWASWDRDILSRLPAPEDARQIIISRQSESDADQDEAEIIADYFARRLDSLGYNSDRDVIRIPVNIVAQWYGQAMGERLSTTKISRLLGQMISEEKIPQLSKEIGRTYGRCFIWAGDYADALAVPDNDLISRLQKFSQASN